VTFSNKFQKKKGFQIVQIGKKERIPAKIAAQFPEFSKKAKNTAQSGEVSPNCAVRSYVIS